MWKTGLTHRTRSFTLKQVLLFASLTILAGTFIIMYNYHQAYNNAARLSEQLSVEITRNVTNRITEYLNQASTSLKILLILEQGSRSLLPNPAREPILWEQLLSQDGIASIFIADREGRFIQTRTQPERAYREVRPANGQWIENWRYKDDELITHRLETYIGDYTPLTRNWYLQANQANQLYVTPVYRFASTGQYGITLSLPLFDATGQKTKVAALDITLDSLQGYLQSQAQLLEGELVMFSNTGEVIVSSCPDNQCKVATSQVFSAYRQQTSSGKLPAAGDDILFSIRDLQIGDNGWTLATLTSANQLFGPTRAATRQAMLVSFIILMMFIGMVYLLARRMGRPIIDLARQAHELKSLNTDFEIPTDSDITEIQMAQDALNSLKSGMSAFSRYIPKTLVRQLIESGVEIRIGGEEKMLAVMFTDIENFTTISEALSPTELTTQLSDYFELMSTTIMDNAGTIDKYIGDAVLAFWGAPLEVEHPVHRAVTTAQMLIRKLAIYNQERIAKGQQPFKTRIGIHYGKTLVGNIGSSERINYTILGDTVNQAARLESINKEYGTQLLMSEAVHEQLGDDIPTRFLDEVQLKGKTATTRIYTLDEEDKKPA